MNLLFKTLWLPILAFSLSGCASQNGGEAVRGVAQSWVTARAFDRAQVAIRRDDMAGLERAGRELQPVAGAASNPRLAGALINQLAIEAEMLFQQSRAARGAEKGRLAENSNLKYRAALAFASSKSLEKSLDARNLNALGYFLADKGSTREDFERAVVLTRAAYRTWDISGKTPDDTELSRAAGAQDSYAWALFKLGKYREALAQQQKVWDLVRGMGEGDANAEIPFHLGEIYRALDQDKKARRAYEAALAIATVPELRRVLESRLEALDLARV